MLSLCQITAIIAFTSTVIATPVIQNGKRTFTLRSLQESRRSNELLDTIKYRRSLGLEVPPNLHAAAHQQANRERSLSARALKGEIRLKFTSLSNGFITPFQIGDKTLQLGVGTASSDTWVYSSLQPSTQLENHTYYKVNPANEIKGAYFETLYTIPGYSLKGKVYREQVTLGNLTTSMAFGAAERVNPDFVKNLPDHDGMMGLGPSYAGGFKPKPQLTFFDSILPQLEKPVFCVALRDDNDSTIDFGHIDEEKITGEITYTDNVYDNWPAWGVEGQGYSIGNDTKMTPKKMYMHFDTDTVVSYTEPEIVEHVYSNIPNSTYDGQNQAYTLPCETSNVEDITFFIAGSKQVLPGKYIIGSFLDTNPKTNVRMCYGRLQKIGGGVRFSLLGVGFLREKYLIVDQKVPHKARIGFAQQC